MTRTLAYFFLLCTFFSNAVFAQNNEETLKLKEGLYYLNVGLANRKNNTSIYLYGIGMTYRYSEKLDVLGAALRHNFNLADEAIMDVSKDEEIRFKKNQIQLSYGLENSDTIRYGMKYPFYVRGQYNVNLMQSALEAHITNRYYPDFYDEEPLHFVSLGAGLKKSFYIFEEEIFFHTGPEISRLWHRDHKWFANYFIALEKAWLKQYFTRFEYADNVENSDMPHVKDWMTSVTLGYIY